PADERDLEPPLRQMPGRGLADAGAGSRDDGDALVQAVRRYYDPYAWRGSSRLRYRRDVSSTLDPLPVVLPHRLEDVEDKARPIRPCGVRCPTRDPVRVAGTAPVLDP